MMTGFMNFAEAAARFAAAAVDIEAAKLAALEEACQTGGGAGEGPHRPPEQLVAPAGAGDPQAQRQRQHAPARNGRDA